MDLLTIPLIMLAIFWSIAIALWLTTGNTFYLFNFGDIAGYIQSGRRVLSTECVMCLECVNACAKGALFANLGVDQVRI